MRRASSAGGGTLRSASLRLPEQRIGRGGAVGNAISTVMQLVVEGPFTDAQEAGRRRLVSSREIQRCLQHDGFAFLKHLAERALVLEHPRGKILGSSFMVQLHFAVM